ncbi:MAG: transposase [Chitinispirillaceae bacterium]|nr:transposase [Chitinispirillaceae bacterium]
MTTLRQNLATYVHFYNHERPHKVLGKRFIPSKAHNG